jgi:uncharacterized DUF497 family protein
VYIYQEEHRMTFEWDANKSVENILKHGVSFEEAQRAFFDVNRKIYRDDKHSINEERYFCCGMVEGEILTVRFTVRGETIRIIGAGYWRKGRTMYYENVQE